MTSDFQINFHFQIEEISTSAAYGMTLWLNAPHLATIQSKIIDGAGRDSCFRLIHTLNNIYSSKSFTQQTFHFFCFFLSGQYWQRISWHILATIVINPAILRTGWFSDLPVLVSLWEAPQAYSDRYHEQHTSKSITCNNVTINCIYLSGIDPARIFNRQWDQCRSFMKWRTCGLYLQ